jgi:hypothetical protein
MTSNSDYFSPPPVEGVSGGGTAYGWIDASPYMLTTDGESCRKSTSDLVSVWQMPSTANLGHQEQPRLLEDVSIHSTAIRYTNCMNF